MRHRKREKRHRVRRREMSVRHRKRVCRREESQTHDVKDKADRLSYGGRMPLSERPQGCWQGPGRRGVGWGGMGIHKGCRLETSLRAQ